MLYLKCFFIFFIVNLGFGQDSAPSSLQQLQYFERAISDQVNKGRSADTRLINQSALMVRSPYEQAVNEERRKIRLLQTALRMPRPNRSRVVNLANSISESQTQRWQLKRAIGNAGNLFLSLRLANNPNTAFENWTQRQQLRISNPPEVKQLIRAIRKNGVRSITSQFINGLKTSNSGSTRILPGVGPIWPPSDTSDEVTPRSNSH